MEATGDVLQHRDWLPGNACFGCGPHNPRGLQIHSRIGADGATHATWRAAAHFQGPPGVVNGGLLAAPMDCHGNWRAMLAFRERAESDGRDATDVASVTGTYTVRLARPTPVETDVHLRAELTELDGRKARVLVTATVDGEVTATFDGLFLEVPRAAAYPSA